MPEGVGYPPNIEQAMAQDQAMTQGAMQGMVQGATPQDSGGQRSALAYLESAKDLLTAAADEYPDIAPYIQKASEVIAMGLERIGGQGNPVSTPPGSGAMPPEANQMGAPAL